MPQFRERIAGLFAASSSTGIALRVSGDTQDRIVVDAGGRIAWSSGSTTSDLNIQRASASLARLTGAIVINDNASGDANSGLRIVSSAATTHTNWRIGTQMLVGGLEFTPSTAVGGTTFSTPAMVILNNSNIGIGTTSPGQKVDIVGRTRHRADASVSAGTWLTDLAGTENVFVGLMGTSSTNAYGVYSSGNWRFNIHNSGGVTIGSSLSATDPGAGNLRVSGVVTVDGGITGTLTGNASTATLATDAVKLQTARNINEVSFNGSANITIPRVRAIDDRTIAPADVNAVYVTAAFSSWANNNNAPYADTLVFRTYSDASGGSDNMLSLRKDALGLRIWQQTYGSATAFATFKDVAWTDGTNATGTWTIATSGNAGSATILQNGRNINGTSFNGSADITTSTWGTSRTLTIGTTGKAVNGSANVAWSVSEIGAASKAELESVLGDLMHVGTYDAAANGPTTKPVPTWSGGQSTYRHGMYWIVSSSGDLSFLTVDLSQREQQNADGTTPVSRADWIIATNPNYVPTNPNVNLTVNDIVWKWISFSAENYIRQEIGKHALDINDPHSAAGYLKTSIAEDSYAPKVHNHNLDIDAKITAHVNALDPHPSYMTASEVASSYYSKVEVNTQINNIAKELVVTDGAPSARAFIGSVEPAVGVRLVGDLWFETPNISLQVPAAAVNFTGTPVSSSQIDLSWAAWPTTTQQNNITLQRQVGGNWTSPLDRINNTNTPPYQTSFSDTGLSANTSYVYRVRAGNVTGAGPWTEITVTTPPIIDTTPPEVPTINHFKPVQSIFTVTNKALTSNVATLTTSAAHGLAIDDWVSVWDVDSTFNGTWLVTGVTSTTFTFACTAANVGSVGSSGSISRYGSMEVSVTWPADSAEGEIKFYTNTGASPFTWTGAVSPGTTTRNFRVTEGVNARGIPGNTTSVYVRVRDANNNWSASANASYILLTSPYTIVANSSNSWRNEYGGRYNALGNFRLAQGYFSVPALNSVGLWYYGTNIADQIWSANRVFNNVEIYMRRNTGGSGSPQDVSIALHNELTNPGTVSGVAAPTTYETPTVAATLAWNGGTAWAKIPSAWQTSLLNGTRKGVAIKDTDGVPYVILDSVAENGYSGTLRITHLG